MTPSRPEKTTPTGPLAGPDDRLEEMATRLLVDSLKTLGRGEYPFYSGSYLRRMSAADVGSSCEEEAQHPEPPLRQLKAVWRLARKARLNSIELDVLRVVAGGTDTAGAARLLGISPGRARRLLNRAVDKMRAHAASVRETLDEQIAQVMREEQARRGHGCERHCRPGREACRRTGVCARRWYLLRDLR